MPPINMSATGINQTDLTSLLVYGEITPDADDPNLHIRDDIASSAPDSVSISMTDYMTAGAGRYARPSQAPIIDAFFADALPLLGGDLADGTYTAVQVSSALGLTTAESSRSFGMSQYVTDPSSADFIERAYIFGSTSFTLADTLSFTVDDGTYTVNGVEVRAFDDNFDFQSSSAIASTANAALNAAFDPYGLIPEVGGTTLPVDINFSGVGRVYTGSYSYGDYLAEGALDILDNALPHVAAAEFALHLAGLASNTLYLGAINADNRFDYYTDDGKKIIYGTNGDDTITGLSAEVTIAVYTSFQMVGGKGNDSITGSTFGDELWGGEGNDTIDGGLGDDRIIGGAGDDTIDGGSFIFGTFEGEDVSVYSGARDDYSIEFMTDGTVRITDSLGRDGTDTLEGVEFAEFSDATVSLKPGQDIAFVIDTTGSMWDDIAAVRSAANGIIDAIYDPARGLEDSRIAVVGFNDPHTSTFLSFTDQPDPEDRQVAAFSAINSVTVGGGGDFPEMTYGGLLRALNGGAGEWREEAVARKIVLFGDATAKDASLASTVYRLASDLSVSAAAPSVSRVADGIDMTSFSMVEAAPGDIERVVPVQIFTVAIGYNSAAIAEYAAIAEATGGSAFRAASASDIVDALLEVINLPIYTISVETPSVTEGDRGTQTVEFTITRDVADDAATVELARGGSADRADLSLSDTSVSFAVGETTKTVTVTINGDTEFEPTDTITLGISSVSEPATFGAATATLSIANDDTETELDNVITGTSGRDTLVGTSGDDVIYSLAGNYDRMTGGDGADDFVFGIETDNGVRERDVITDFDVLEDRIILSGSANVGAIEKTTNQVVIFFEGDGDVVYIRGEGVETDNITVFEQDGMLAFI